MASLCGRLVTAEATGDGPTAGTESGMESGLTSGTGNGITRSRTTNGIPVGTTAGLAIGPRSGIPGLLGIDGALTTVTGTRGLLIGRIGLPTQETIGIRISGQVTGIGGHRTTTTTTTTTTTGRRTSGKMTSGLVLSGMIGVGMTRAGLDLNGIGTPITTRSGQPTTRNGDWSLSCRSDIDSVRFIIISSQRTCHC